MFAIFEKPRLEADRTVLLIKAVQPVELDTYQKIGDFEIYGAKLDLANLH